MTIFKIKSDRHLTFLETSQLFDISMITLFQLGLKSLNPTQPATKIDMEALKQDIETYPDAYQFERAKRLGVSSGGIFHALKRLKVTYQLLPAKAGSS